MSDNFGCKNCGRSHMGGLSCFYGISKKERHPITKNNPSGKKSSPRKLLKNKFARIDGGTMSFKQFVTTLGSTRRGVVNEKSSKRPTS